VVTIGTKIYLYDITNAKLHDLLAEGIIPVAEFNAGNWIDNQDFAYYTTDGLYIIDTTYNPARPLLTIRSSDDNPYNSKDF